MRAGLFCYLELLGLLEFGYKAKEVCQTLGYNEMHTFVSWNYTYFRFNSMMHVASVLGVLMQMTGMMTRAWQRVSSIS